MKILMSKISIKTLQGNARGSGEEVYVGRGSQEV